MSTLLTPEQIALIAQNLQESLQSRYPASSVVPRQGPSLSSWVESQALALPVFRDGNDNEPTAYDRTSEMLARRRKKK